MNLKSVFFITLAFGLLASACNKTTVPATNNDSATATTTPPSVILSQTYTNTKYGYSFEYPAGYKLDSSGEAGFSAPATNDSSSINAYNNNHDFQMTVNADISLSPNFSQKGIENHFSATAPKDIIVTPINMFGANGYKVTFSSNVKGVISDFYFIQKPNGPIFQMIVAKSNPISLQIFGSFKFTQ
jgi:hypothetical protein